MSTATVPPPFQFDLYFMIPDVAAARVMLLEGEAGWVLPHHRPDDPGEIQITAMCALLREQFGADVTFLRIAQAYIDRDVARTVREFYALENHDPAWQPPTGARWFALDELGDLALDPPAHEAISSWLGEETSGQIPPERPGWARRGWLAEVAGWIAARLAEQGLALDGPLEQVKSWGISCLLRGQTDAGSVYFKGAATLPLFTNEPAVTATLAGLYPACVPRPIAVDAERRWMLTMDFGGAPLYQVEPPPWATAIAAYSALQRESLAHTADLLAAGCLDRRLPQLAAGIEPLVRDTFDFYRMTAEEKSALAAAAPRLQAACDRLAEFGIPDTLVHGDLHEANIAVNNGVPIYFDWSDACIAHPFMDLATMLDPDWLGEKQDRAALLDLYLEGWTGYATLPDLREAAKLAMLLGALHQSISYQNIVLSLEPAARWELEGGWRSWVLRLLAALNK